MEKKTTERRLERLSKFISMILRHRPEVIGITLDEHGWANVDELIEGINKTEALAKQLLRKL